MVMEEITGASCPIHAQSRFQGHLFFEMFGKESHLVIFSVMFSTILYKEFFSTCCILVLKLEHKAT